MNLPNDKRNGDSDLAEGNIVSSKRRLIGLMLSVLLVFARPLLSASTLTDLYEELFRGARVIHLPERLFSLTAEAKRLVEIPLTDRYPFMYNTYHFKDNYQFLRLTNDDDSKFFFDTLENLGNSDSAQGIAGITFDKRSKKIDVVTALSKQAYENFWGYYTKRKSESKGGMRLDLENNGVIIKSAGKAKAGYIMNPKDVDAGANQVFLSSTVATKSDFSYIQADRDIELFVLDWAQETITHDLVLPFTSNYSPIYTHMLTFSNQSVANQNYVYFVLMSNFRSNPTITLPKTLYPWHVLIYDLKEDALYSIWHGMDDSDGKKAVSFSYYLGKDGLYFEVLKEGKIEVYLVDIDLKNAKPLKEYETVDLLWNNKGLKAQWEKKIQEAKAKDPSFEERWE